MGQGSVSVILKQREQKIMLSFMRIIASDRRRAWSVGLRRRKKARRCAVFTPTPGNFENSSISAATGGAISLIVLEQSWNFHAPGSVINKLLLGIGGPVKGILSSRLHHDLKLSNIFRSKRLRVNFDARNFKLATHGDRDRTTTSSTSKLACLQIFLHFQQLLLHLLNFAHVHSYSLLLDSNGQYEAMTRRTR